MWVMVGEERAALPSRVRRPRKCEKSGDKGGRERAVVGIRCGEAGGCWGELVMKYDRLLALHVTSRGLPHTTSHCEK